MTRYLGHNVDTWGIYLVPERFSLLSSQARFTLSTDEIPPCR